MNTALSPAPAFHTPRHRGLLAVVVLAHLLVIGALVHSRHAQPIVLQQPHLVAWLLAPETPPAPSITPVEPVVTRKQTAPTAPTTQRHTHTAQAAQTREDPQALIAEPIAQLPAPATAQENAPTPQTQPVAAPAEPAAPPVTAPRFDLAYLNNPPPAYPAASRRAGEQGKALLRVLVGLQGEVLRIELLQSSGFDRLDQAALDAVRAWRFVPARRGEEVVQAWAVVPLNFRLS
ncbi:MAG: energy transducer TonB [Burkholderiaceae bacterium]